MCSIICEKFNVQLPNLHLYPPASTMNKTVHRVVKEEFIRFWKGLRRHDCNQDMKQFVGLSKGAAMELVESTRGDPGLDMCKGHAEARLLQPIFSADTNLKQSYRSCTVKQDVNVLECLAKEVRSNKDCKGLKGEMILSSIWLLNVALNVSVIGWHVINTKVDVLRTDKYALGSIRSWDFNTVIPQILYLTFRLHARQVIARLTGDSKEAETVLTMKTNLKQALETEFFLSKIKEVKRECNLDGSLNYYKNGTELKIFAVREVHLISVNRENESGRRSTLFIDDSILYIGIGEYLFKEDPKAPDIAFRRIIREVKSGNLIFHANPMIYYF